jgi:transcriptional regulator with XRE-family HTH domain
VAEPTNSLAEVIGRNVKQMRRRIGATQDDLARYARDVGLRWTASTVGDFEAGRSAPTFATVIAVSTALERAVLDVAKQRDGEPDLAVTLAELVSDSGVIDGEGFVALNDSLDVAPKLLQELCRGAVAVLPTGTWHARLRSHSARDVQAMLDRDVQNMAKRSGLTEHRLAQRIGVSPNRLAVASFRLWKRTFSEERDRRAGPGANQQKRGQVSRTLRAELEKALADGND